MSEHTNEPADGEGERLEKIRQDAMDRLGKMTDAQLAAEFTRSRDECDTAARLGAAFYVQERIWRFSESFGPRLYEVFRGLNGYPQMLLLCYLHITNIISTDDLRDMIIKALACGVPWGAMGDDDAEWVQKKMSRLSANTLTKYERKANKLIDDLHAAVGWRTVGSV